MDWFLAAVLSAVGLSAQALLFQRLQRHYAINAFMAYAWLGAAALLAVVYLRPQAFAAIAHNALPLALSGLTSMAGNYAYNRAIRLQGNIGYVEAIMSWRLILTYFYSLLLLQAHFEALRLAGMILIIAGVLAVSGAWRMKTRDLKIAWLSWALLGGFCFALNSIFARFATDDGVSAEVALLVVLLIAGFSFLGAAIYQGRVAKGQAGAKSSHHRGDCLRRVCQRRPLHRLCKSAQPGLCHRHRQRPYHHLVPGGSGALQPELEPRQSHRHRPDLRWHPAAGMKQTRPARPYGHGFSKQGSPGWRWLLPCTYRA